MKRSLDLGGYLKQALDFLLFPFKWLWGKIKGQPLESKSENTPIIESPLIKTEPPLAEILNTHLPETPLALTPQPIALPNQSVLFAPAQFTQEQLTSLETSFSDLSIEEQSKQEVRAQYLRKFILLAPPIELFVRLHEESGVPMIGFKPTIASPLAIQSIQFLEKLAMALGLEITNPDSASQDQGIRHIFVRKYTPEEQQQENPYYAGHPGYDFLEIFMVYPEFLTLLNEDSIDKILKDENNVTLQIDGHADTLESVLQLKKNKPQIR